MMHVDLHDVLASAFGAGEWREEWRVVYRAPNGWTYKSGGYSSRTEAVGAAGRIWPSKVSVCELQLRHWVEWQDGSKYTSAWTDEGAVAYNPG